MKADRTVAPDIQQVREVRPLKYALITLDQGSPLYLTEHGDSKLFRLVIRFDGGTFAEHKTLQAQLTAKMLLQGTHDKNSLEIAQILDFYGAKLNPVVERDFFSLKVQALRKDFEPVMKLIFELVHNSVFPEKEFEQIKKRLYAQYKTNIKKKSYVAQNEMKPLLFGKKHPYGHKIDEDAFPSIQLNDLKEYYRRIIEKGRVRLFVSGIEHKNAQSILNGLTGELHYKAMNTKPDEALVIPPNKRKEVHVIQDDAVQSAIRLGWKTGNRNHPDFIELKILNTILGGYFGSRLMKNLREEKGLTYGIGSAIGSTQQTGLWIIATEIGAENTQIALQEIYREINRLKTTSIEEEELKLIQNYLPGKILRSLEKDFDKLDSFVELSDHNLPPDYYSTFLKKIREIDAERIKELANQYLLFDNISEVVIGKI
ncbi:MAG: insulinase family protein [Bacteroidales bacterium]|nr:insulinase family protein [Bacteroidales bacterium]